MSAAEQQISSPCQVDHKLIYVVDDEPMIGDVVQIILKIGGYKPRIFIDPAVAVRAFIEEERKPALLLTDFAMTPINGMELIEQCKPHHPHLRTILYSGNAGEEILHQYSVKPDAFLRKPFLPRALLGLVQKTLSSSGAVGLFLLLLVLGLG